MQKDGSFMDMSVKNGDGTSSEPFWMRKTFEEMSEAEWESLCDGCARCCLNKVLDWDTDEVLWTSLSCKLLDEHTCRCKDYGNRSAEVPDCVKLTPGNLSTIRWLPPSCAYRLLEEGRDLYWWHPLVSGSPETVHQAGISVRGRIVCEEGVAKEDYEYYLVDWPNEALDEEEISETV